MTEDKRRVEVESILTKIRSIAEESGSCLTVEESRALEEYLEWLDNRCASLFYALDVLQKEADNLVKSKNAVDKLGGELMYVLKGVSQ